MYIFPIEQNSTIFSSLKKKFFILCVANLKIIECFKIRFNNNGLPRGAFLQDVLFLRTVLINSCFILKTEAVGSESSQLYGGAPKWSGLRERLYRRSFHPFLPTSSGDF